MTAATTTDGLPLAAQLVEYYFDCGPDVARAWPPGFREACYDWAFDTSIAPRGTHHAGAVRWEFKDGSAIVEVHRRWDYGVHRDHISAAFDLTTAEEDVYFVWPESHPAIPAAWTGAPLPPEEE